MLSDGPVIETGIGALTGIGEVYLTKGAYVTEALINKNRSEGGAY